MNLRTVYPGGTRGKESVCQCRDRRDASLLPGSGRLPEGGNDNPLQHFCLENLTEEPGRLQSMRSQRGGCD